MRSPSLNEASLLITARLQLPSASRRELSYQQPRIGGSFSALQLASHDNVGVKTSGRYAVGLPGRCLTPTPCTDASSSGEQPKTTTNEG